MSFSTPRGLASRSWGRGSAATTRGVADATILRHRSRRRHRHAAAPSFSSRPRHSYASNFDEFGPREEPEDDEDCSHRTVNRRRALLSAASAGGFFTMLSSSASFASPSSSSPSSSPPPPPPPPPSTTSPSLDSIRSAYDSYSEDYDSLDGGALADFFGFSELRRRAVAAASGKVLELGVGTGLNLPLYYDSSLSSSSSPSSSPRVTSLTAVDLSPGMLSVAARRIEQLGLGKDKGKRGLDSSSPLLPPPPPLLVAADAAALPFEAASFDTVIDTFSLCVFPDPRGALSEARRVLEPRNGRIVLVEHCRSDAAVGLLGAYQDATAGLIAGKGGAGGGGGKGCVWNQDVRSMMEEFFVVEREERAAAGTVGLFIGRPK